MRSNRVLIVLIALSLLAAGTAWAQMPTGTISGRVIHEGQGLPGVSVIAKSPALQGARTAVTGNTGDYVFASLPPGDYTLTYALSGFQPTTKTLKLGASQVVRTDATLSLTAVAAEATVIGRSEAISTSTTQATTVTAELVAKLPTARTIISAVLLAPGVVAGVGGNLQIAGAMSTENVYTVNGVNVVDNVFGTPYSMFIEDAIQETTTSTAGVSAEYGRFTGGVINTITKSGGNTFSGSLRDSLSNDAWRSTSAYRNAAGANPQEGTFLNKVIPTYEATIGGPILKDKIWFFGAGRYFDTVGNATATTGYTNITYPTGTYEARYEGKLTLSPFQNQTLTGSYLNNYSKQVNRAYPNSAGILDTASIFSPNYPSDLITGAYNGVLTDSLFVDGQYSRRKFAFNNYGSTYTDLIRGTLLLDTTRGSARYNAPTFSAASPETRDDEEFLVKGTYFLSTPSLGSHNIVAGYDDFSGQRMANNYQSGSNFRIYGKATLVGTTVYPVFDTATFFYYQPIGQLSVGSDMKTYSAFLNDTWRVNNRLSFNLGVRWDKNHAVDQGGILTANDSAYSPRLALSYDVTGDGKLRTTASYAHYVGGIQENIAGSGATAAGSTSTYQWYYRGPGATLINPDPDNPTLSTADALTQFFAWFQSVGCLPDPTSAACTAPMRNPPSLAGVTTLIPAGLTSPTAREYVLGFSGGIGGKGTFRSDFVRREYKDFYDAKKDLSTGTVVVNGKTYDLTQIVNSNDYRREYTALQTQFAYRFGEKLSLGGSWTWSHLIGDVVGEGSTTGTVSNGLHSMPEYFDRKWNSPVGDLSTDVRHRVRVYGSYDLGIPMKFGALSFGAIESWDKGNPYSAVGSVESYKYVTNPGYAIPPTGAVSYYFTSRDAYRYEDVFSTDISLNYSYRIAGTVEVFFQAQVRNAFNSQHVVAVNQTVYTAYDSPSTYTAFNPFTTAAPIECPQGQTAAQCKAMGANWQKGPNFGKPTGTASYQTPRLFMAAVGLRF